MNIDDLQAELATIELFFEKTLGYSRVYDVHFEVRKECLRLFLNATDNFQSDLDYGKRFQHGLMYYDSDSFSLDEIWDQLRDLRRRPYRELRTLLTVSGNAAELQSKLVSAAAIEFADMLIEPRRAYAALLEDLDNGRG